MADSIYDELDEDWKGEEDDDDNESEEIITEK